VTTKVVIGPLKVNAQEWMYGCRLHDVRAGMDAG
jgi:hypothetical protein